MSLPRDIPRILIDWATPSELTAAETLDIKEVLEQAGGFPNLLSRNSVYDFATSFTCDDDLPSRAVPAFPDGHQPPLFIVHSHRAQLPFPLRPEMQEIGDFCWDEEDFRPILTVPTTPRMKLMIKERIFVHKWVDSLTTDDPPQHVPWGSDRPVQEKKWVSEGSIFPAEMIQSLMQQRRKNRACVPPTSCRTCPTPSRPGNLHTFREPSVVSSGSTKDSRWSIQMPVRGRREITQLAPPTPKSSVPPIGRCSISKLPLAARRGKVVTSLHLKGSLVEELEYPDFPTAFRGSSSTQPPEFDCRGPPPPFTDHQVMLSSLRSKCAALTNVFSTPEREKEIHEPTTPLTPDEYEFSQGLANFERRSMGPLGGCPRLPPILRLCFDGKNGRKTSDDFNEFGPKVCSVPAHAVTGAQIPSTISTSSSSPPGVPLPLRPALINPATPPHVRGILKKAKSVRFEDLIGSDVWENDSANGPPIQEQPPILKRPSPLRHSFIATPSKVKTALQLAAKTEDVVPKVVPPQDPAESTKRAPRPRLAAKDTGLKSKQPGPDLPHKEGSWQLSHPSPEPQATAAVGRPCRIASAIQESSILVTSQAQRNKRSSVTSVNNLQRGLDGVPKSRLSTPLRNIFRFK